MMMLIVMIVNVLETFLVLNAPQIAQIKNVEMMVVEQIIIIVEFAVDEQLA